MMNMNTLAVGTPPYIYHGYSTWKKFWAGKLTGEEKFTLGEFTDVKMKHCGCWNVRKHIGIKGSDIYITLDILL